jgi:hypothetical protein
MALDQESLDKLIGHIREKWGARSCPMCHANNWLVQGFVPLILSDSVKTVTIGGKSLPSAAVICSNCGNTIIVNLIAAKVVSGSGANG